MAISKKKQAYKQFFQRLIDDLRENHQFTGARKAHSCNWYCFHNAGVSGIAYKVVFLGDNQASVLLRIRTGDIEKSKFYFDVLRNKKDIIENEYGAPFIWERLDGQDTSKVAIYKDGSIEDGDLSEIHQWMIDNLLKIKEVFAPKIKEFK